MLRDPLSSGQNPCPILLPIQSLVSSHLPELDFPKGPGLLEESDHLRTKQPLPLIVKRTTWETHSESMSSLGMCL